MQGHQRAEMEGRAINHSFDVLPVIAYCGIGSVGGKTNYRDEWILTGTCTVSDVFRIKCFDFCL